MYKRYLAATFLVLLGRATFAVAQATHGVDVGPGFSFSPNDLVIDVGDTVCWTWIGGLHNVESGVGGVHDGRFRSGDPTDVDGTTYAITFDRSFLDKNPAEGNVYDYYCFVHVGLGMTGAITVVGAVDGDGDGDGDVDLDDFQQFAACRSGPGIPFDANGATTHVVSVGPGMIFAPPAASIEVGDTVRWTWVSGLHNIESGAGGVHDGSFRSGDPTGVSGTTYEVTFDRAFLDAHPMAGDVYSYYCIVHVAMGMTGSVTVEADACAVFDFDGDGDIDLVDFGMFQTVFGGA